MSGQDCILGKTQDTEEQSPLKHVLYKHDRLDKGLSSREKGVQLGSPDPFVLALNVTF